MRGSRNKFICLSAAPILRCESLSTIESAVTIIPPALELLFAVSLLVGKWRSGSRRHLLLVAEGWTFFSLALIDVLSHLIPAIRSSIGIFRILDILIASLSFLPLLLYTLYLFLLASGTLIPNLPQRYQPIIRCLIIIFIPMIVLFNEVGSFVGISRRILPGFILAIGFTTPKDQTLWTFFSSFTLALLTVYQVIMFFLAFYQLLRVFIDQRRIETSQSDEAHLIRGIGWVAGGLKLGAIETLLGFAPVGFGGAFTRRLLRLLARACLVIGIVKGMDTFEDFHNLHEKLGGRPPDTKFRRSRLKSMISNPRNSTFRHLSPSAAALPEVSRAPQPLMPERSPSMATFDMTSPTVLSPGVMPLPTPVEYQSAYYPASSSGGYQTPGYASSIGFQSPSALSTLTPGLKLQRVTVNYENGQAPTLEMRFSALDMPSPTALTEGAGSIYPSGAAGRLSTISSAASSYASSTFLQNPPKAMSRPASARSRSTLDIGGGGEESVFDHSNTDSPHLRAKSQDTLGSDTLAAVHDLAVQFPRLPSHVTGNYSQSVMGEHYSDEEQFPSRMSSVKTNKSDNSPRSAVHTISPSNSMTRRIPVLPMPPLDTGAPVVSRAESRNDTIRAEAGHQVSGTSRDDETTASSPHSQVSSSFGIPSRRASSVATAAEDHHSFPYGNDTPVSGTFRSSEYGGDESIRSVEWLATASRGQRVKAVDIEALRSRVTPNSAAVSEAALPGAPSTARDGSEPTSWPTDTHVVEAQREVWGENDLTRIKSVGSVPRMRTPVPTRPEFSGVSVSLERMEFEALMEKVREDEHNPNSDTPVTAA